MRKLVLTYVLTWGTVIWIGCILSLGLSLDASCGTEVVIESRATAIPPEEQALHHNLKRLARIIQQAKRVETVVYGPYRRAEGTKKCGARCKQFVLDVKGHALQAEMEHLCGGVLGAIKSGEAKLPQAVATLAKESDEEPYYRFVSGIAREYWTAQEPRFRKKYAEINGYKPKEEVGKAVQTMMGQEQENLERDFLERNAYGQNSWLVLTLQKPYFERDPVAVSPLVRKLYANGTAADGRKRYLQLLYFPDKERHPGKDIVKITTMDLTPDLGFGFASSFGPGAGYPERYVALGILEFEGRALPWYVALPTKSKINVPGEWEKEDWRYVVKIDSDLSDLGTTNTTCSYVIK